MYEFTSINIVMPLGRYVCLSVFVTTLKVMKGLRDFYVGRALPKRKVIKLCER